MKIEFRQRYSNSLHTESIKAVECCGPSTLWAVGADTFLRSTNGGSTWTDFNYASPVNSDTKSEQIAFCSENEGLLLAVSYDLVDFRPGTTQEQIAIVAEDPGVHLVPKSADLVYFRTEDGGRTWLKLRRISEGRYVWYKLFSVSHAERFWCLIKLGDGNAFIEIFDARSHSWQRVGITIRGDPSAIVFSDRDKGWILELWHENTWIPDSPRVQKTTTVLHHSSDGGASWKIICVKEWFCWKLVALGDNKLIMVGEDGIFGSTDGGYNWERVTGSPRMPLFDVHFKGLIGVALGSNDIIKTTSDVLLLITTDGGKNWHEVEAPAALSFMTAKMITWSRGLLADHDSIYTFDLI